MYTGFLVVQSYVGIVFGTSPNGQSHTVSAYSFIPYTTGNKSGLEKGNTWKAGKKR